MKQENAGTGILCEELRSLIRARSPEAVAALDLATMDRLSGTIAGLDMDALIGHYQAFLVNAIQRLPEGPYSKAASALFVEVGSGASVKERNSAASGNFGVGYDAFRRATPSGVSKEDEVIGAVAGVMLSKSSARPSGSLVSKPGSAGSFRRLLGRRVAIGVVASGVIAMTGLLVLVLDDGDMSSAMPAPAVVTSTMATAPSRFPPSTSVTASSTPTTLNQPATTELAPFAGRPVLGEVEADCEFAPGDTDDLSAAGGSWAASFQAVYRNAGGKPAIGCPIEPMTDRGGMQWQELQRFGFANGGFIGIAGYEAMLLNRGQWRSYIRIGGGDGSASPALGGFPTGEVIETSDGWTMKLAGQVELIGEGEDSSYYWVPKIVVDVWDAAGRSGGIHGRPAGSPRLVPEGVRQDFANGYFTFQSGNLGWTPVIDTAAELPPTEELAGHIITAADGTGWLIDSQLRRWWLVDISSWNCAGGSPNEVATNLPGYAVHTLDFAGVATCPASAGGAYAAGGAADVNTYCTNAVSIGTDAEVVDDRWNCVDGPVRQVVDMQLLCDWQYGPDAYADESEGLYGIICKS